MKKLKKITHAYSSLQLYSLKRIEDESTFNSTKASSQNLNFWRSRSSLHSSQSLFPSSNFLNNQKNNSQSIIGSPRSSTALAPITVIKSIPTHEGGQPDDQSGKQIYFKSYFRNKNAHNFSTQQVAKPESQSLNNRTTQHFSKYSKQTSLHNPQIDSKTEEKNHIKSPSKDQIINKKLILEERYIFSTKKQHPKTFKDHLSRLMYKTPKQLVLASPKSHLITFVNQVAAKKQMKQYVEGKRNFGSVLLELQEQRSKADQKLVQQIAEARTKVCSYHSSVQEQAKSLDRNFFGNIQNEQLMKQKSMRYMSQRSAGLP